MKLSSYNLLVTEYVGMDRQVCIIEEIDCAILIHLSNKCFSFGFHYFVYVFVYMYVYVNLFLLM
jgi:hypothetical protein